ncbi:hypothetical protein VOLCADRAFT_107685 [Volvox carteri f. nagariensis]|uniref:Uncharacterized protein n=1 Tax=Volvox carteri f. nagariensis TaxID=3068 RepID=D8UFM2_VOLCA|nr:uncharacterized protein VOLCADRAFT_107685 [Volvox carteri f. nagariensis]EFJ41527.1 hypothetical protein VOLCADRAFT_107685 [Volvox carteri f. nagariensis]|eukprot:XP_002957472.1 hypothetical protein VOLCADRAFT_107685 [Volvox carteri f. nagariensis]
MAVSRPQGQRCHAQLNRQRSLLVVSLSEYRSSKRKTPVSTPQQCKGQRGSPATASLAAAELTASIRACSSPAQLLNLYQLHGSDFNAFQAHTALNRLVDVTSFPPSGDLDPQLNGVSLEDGQRTQEQPGELQFTPQLTGRLRVLQGQEVAQPPLHGDQDEDAERRESNYEASTSESAPDSPPQGVRSQQKLLLPQKSSQRRPQVAAGQQLQLQQEEQQELGSAMQVQQSFGVSKSGNQAVQQQQDQQPLPPRRLVVSMVSGLVAILSHACHKLDGRDVAEAARALSRLRYQDASMLWRLEQRSLKLMKAGHRTRAPKAVARKEASGTRQRGSSSSNSLPARLDSTGTAGTAVKAGTGAHKLKQSQQQLDRQSDTQQQQQDAQAGMEADGLYTLIAAFGAMGHRPSAAWRAAVVQATEPHLTTFAASPRGRLPLLISYLGAFGATPPLRALAAGLAAMKHIPGGAWMAEYLAASERQLADYSAWELVSTVASLARLRCSPGELWLERFYSCAAAHVGTTGGLTGRLLLPLSTLLLVQAAVLLSSLSHLQCKPAGEWLTLLLLGTRRSLGEATAEELTDVLDTLARLRFRPPELWMQQYFTASFQRLPFQTPEQCCTMAVALSKLGRRPQALWLGELARHMGSKLALMPAGQQSLALAALVELGYVPSSAWLEAYEKQSNAKLAENSAEELCRALEALVKVGFRPQASWLYAFIMAAYSKLDSFGSAQLALIFDRLPELTPHGSWLDEIIQICAAEASMRAIQPQTAQQVQQLELAVATPELAPHHQQPVQGAPQRVLTADQQPAVAGEAVGAAGVDIAVTATPALSTAQPVPVPEAEVIASVEVAAELPSLETAVSEPAGIGLFAAGAVDVSAITSGITTATGSSGNSYSAAAASGSGLFVQDVKGWDALERLAAADIDSAPAAPHGTIAISPDLIPAVGGVLSAGAACGSLLNGAGAGVGMSLSILGDGGGMNTVADLGAANGVGNGAEAGPLQRLQEVERVLVEPGAAASVALTVAGATSCNSQSRSYGNTSISNGSRNPSRSSSGNGNGSRVTSRGRGRGDGPGGGDDGGAPGGEGGGRWTDELAADMEDPSPVGSGAAAGSGRAPDAGNDGRVQYLDSASLSRLMGAPDGPPGPDFSNCQKRARESRAVRGGGGGGPFQLGRIWTNEGAGGGAAAGPITGPIPSPSG